MVAQSNKQYDIKINKMKKTSRKINVIIVAGVSGSGKTTLVKQIKNKQINKNNYEDSDETIEQKDSSEP